MFISKEALYQYQNNGFIAEYTALHSPSKKQKIPRQPKEPKQAKESRLRTEHIPKQPKRTKEQQQEDNIFYKGFQWWLDYRKSQQPLFQIPHPKLPPPKKQPEDNAC